MSILAGSRRLPGWCCGTLLFIAALVTPVAAQSTYNVSTVAELQAALAAVNSGPGGDMIVLAPGFYALTSSLTVSADVSMLGDSSAPAVLDGGGVTVIEI
jgi:hypothetical protein